MEIKTVLCPLDIYSTTDQELQFAASICRRFDARLVLQCNLDTAPPASLGMNWMYAEEHRAQRMQGEAAAEKKLRDSFSKVPAAVRVEGKITHAPRDFSIITVSREFTSDLIVMGRHDPSDSDQMSVAERVLVESSCPVLIVQPDPAAGAFLDVAENQPVIVPVDFTPHSIRTLEYAFALARHLPITLQMVHVEGAAGWRDLHVMAFRRQDARERRLADCKDRLLGMIPADLMERVRVHLRGGSIVEGILRSIQELQGSLVVMGTHQKGFWKKAITGSTAWEILRRSPRPVWFVPTDGGTPSWREEPTAAAEA